MAWWLPAICMTQVVPFPSTAGSGKPMAITTIGLWTSEASLSIMRLTM
jgi:hypothetical protein